MFDEILQAVKEHMGNNPQIASAIPDKHTDAVQQEIATHINDSLQNAPATASAGGGLLSQIESSLSSGGIGTSAIAGGLISSLTSKFGLPPAITGAIAGALPGLLQKFMNRNSASTAAPVA